MLVEKITSGPVEIDGVLESKAFGIQADGKLFKVLLSSIYSRKIESIVRELCANALDSHIDAGIADRPFVLRLPTRFDQTFSVRDYGVSLTHEGVMNLYTVVGMSTKDKDNKTTGKWGLGSKVPFAYTDAFNITAILNGEKRLYNAYIDEDHIPRIALFSCEPTDEEQGLEVSFPTKDEDRNEFEEAAKRVMRGFDVLPIGITMPEREALLEGSNWRYFKKPDGYYHKNAALLRQGCVVYPLDSTQLLKNLQNSRAISDLLYSEIIIDVPIGSVQITASREALDYTPETVAYVLAQLNKVADEISNRFSAELVSIRSPFEARLKWSKLKLVMGDNLAHYVSRLVKWRGKPLNHTWHISSKRLKHLASVGLDIRGIRMRGERWIMEGATESSISVCLYGLHHSVEKIHFLTYGERRPPYLSERIQAAHNQTVSSVFYVIPNFQPTKKNYMRLWVACGMPDNFADWFIDLEKVEFEKPEYVRQAPQVKALGTARRSLGARWVDHTPTEDEIENEALWIDLMGGKPSWDHDNSLDPPTLHRVIEKMREEGLIGKDVPVFGIPKTCALRDKKKPEDWINFQEYLCSDRVTNYFKTEKVAQNDAYLMVSEKQGLYSVWEQVRTFSELIAPLVSQFSPTSPSLALAKELRDFEMGALSLSDYMMMVRLVASAHHSTGETWLKSKKLTEKTAAKISEKLAAFAARYPLIDAVTYKMNNLGSWNRDKQLALAKIAADYVADTDIALRRKKRIAKKVVSE